jgi:hypothetical protein
MGKILKRGYCYRSQERRQKMFLVFCNTEVTADFEKTSLCGMMGLKPGWTDELMEKTKG